MFSLLKPSVRADTRHIDTYKDTSIEQSLLNVLFLQNLTIDTEKFLRLQQGHGYATKYTHLFKHLQSCADRDFDAFVFHRCPGFIQHMRSCLKRGLCLWVNVTDHHVSAFGECGKGLICLHSPHTAMTGFIIIPWTEIIDNCTSYVYFE